MIQEHPEGYLSFAVILNCNNIKKLGVSTNEQLAESLFDSSLVELNEAKDSVRRAGNLAIPTVDDFVDPAVAAKEAEKKELINYYETF